jgi:2-methylisocitrate lyase-like PEP mutase family enzyme
LAEAGVKRVSVGSALARLSLGAFVTGAREMIEDGSFHFGDQALGFAEIETHFAP